MGFTPGRTFGLHGQSCGMIYLDYNATHPPFTDVLLGSQETYLRFFANSSGLSNFSQKTGRLIEECRAKLASEFSLLPKQFIFTSTASEANALVIWSIYR